MKHDEKKIEELSREETIHSDYYGDVILKKDAKKIAKQYAEHMVQQEREAYYKQ
jgi:hypothetical protein